MSDDQERGTGAPPGEGTRGQRSSAVSLDEEDPEGAAASWCLAQYYAELDRRFEGGFDPSAKAYAGTGKDVPPRTIFLVARLDGEPAGCGSLLWTPDGFGEIKRMWVSPGARGRGIARRLLSALEERARALDIRTLRLDTNRVLDEAHAFYRSAGYAEIARYSDNPYAHLWFAKTL